MQGIGYGEGMVLCNGWVGVRYMCEVYVGVGIGIGRLDGYALSHLVDFMNVQNLIKRVRSILFKTTYVLL